ncbi:hypothetical protein LMG28688_00856 [Paraburkholderia caffeinitolerans]|uniref:DUF2939 domain-containing protein n=1 Tax=Paraburkholderia caffeinitolerans TaxID=1723730 RepID=A0A6J5FJS9_9BURK|nr:MULTISPECIES: DUF2939 domain-containing protein [Paraburkholderia]CAB3779492.1 hypothetical protein LMG28688_00856 [Paraburkholderia caffeinitolerans]
MTDTQTYPRKSSSWKKPVAIAVAAVAIVAAVGYGYASPYIALNNLKAAADARDAAALREYVDYPALRASLKQQVGEMLQQRMEAAHASNPLMLFGAMIGNALIGPLVDAYATPEGVAALLSGMPPTGKPGERPAPVPPSEAPPSSPSSQQGGLPPAPGNPPAQAQSPQPRAQTSAGYRSLNTFAVTWQRGSSGNGGERYAAILQRHGLFSWKLAAVELNEPNIGSGANASN